MIAYPFRFRCKQPPRLFLGPLLPASYEQAKLWMKGREVCRLGFATTLHREKQGKAIAIREHGQEAPRSYFVRPL
jgi:hypothetical protein